MGREDALSEVDGIFERAAGDGTIPGIAYGVVIGGELVHAEGLGSIRVGELRSPTPTASSASRR